VKNEWLSIGTLLATAAIAYGASAGSGSKKEAPKKESLVDSIKGKFESKYVRATL
jgi:hypothetical protein